jgi:MbtH protein
MFEDDVDRPYCVVRNDEEQYSIWPADRAPPAGWTAQGAFGTKAECLDHIERTWKDLRPLSLRTAGRLESR